MGLGPLLVGFWMIMKKGRLHQHLQTLTQATVLYLEFIEKLAIWLPVIADLHLAAQTT